MKKIGQLLLYLFFAVVLYMYIFNPYPFRGGVIKLLYPLAVIPIISKYGIKELKRSYSIIVALLAILLFDIIVGLRGGDSKMINSFINIIELVFIPVGIGVFYNRYFERRDIIKDIIIVSSIAAAITLFLALNPETAFVVRMIFNSQTEHAEEVTRRMFGISQFLLFTYSVLLGFLAGYCAFSKGFVKFLFPLLLLGVIFNARIGFVAFFISAFFKVFTTERLRTNILLIAVILIFVPSVLAIMSDMFPDTYNWIVEGFEESQDLYEGKKTGTFENLGDMFVFPSTIDGWLWGTGKDIYREDTNSDIGYILQLNYGGLLYMVLIFLYVLQILKRCNRTLRDRGLVVAVVLTIIIVNFKGIVVSSNEFIRFILLSINCYSIKQLSLSGARNVSLVKKRTKIV